MRQEAGRHDAREHDAREYVLLAAGLELVVHRPQSEVALQIGKDLFDLAL